MIEFFKEPNLDWMGKAKYFFALSGLLLVIGWSAIFFHGGIKYGIDFRGGTNVDVRFAKAPNIDQLRNGLRAQGLGNSEIQSISDMADPDSNEVLIFVEQAGQTDQALDEGKTKVLTALNATYNVSSSNKPDFNSAPQPRWLISHLRRTPWDSPSTPETSTATRKVAGYRDKKRWPADKLG